MREEYTNLASVYKCNFKNVQNFLANRNIYRKMGNLKVKDGQKDKLCEKWIWISEGVGNPSLCIL